MIKPIEDDWMTQFDCLIENNATKCEQCGADFDLTRPDKRFCSERCRKRAEISRYNEKLRIGGYSSRFLSTKNGILRTHNKIKLEECIYDIVPGVYFLLLEDEIVYIGMTNNVVYRIATHVKEHPGAFDRAYVFPYNKAKDSKEHRGIGRVENSYINTYKPRYNLYGWPPPGGNI